VTEGDELAKQYRLPHRLRDFIREHHGTTQVFVFYRRAVDAANGDESSVDIRDFSYPGPIPRSKETAILMLADSCEAAVRSVKPKNRQEINDLVTKIFDDKRKHGQLNDSNLTLNELNQIKESFLDILQGMFHPRINYQEAVAKSNPANTTAAVPIAKPTPELKEEIKRRATDEVNTTRPAANKLKDKIDTSPKPPTRTQTNQEIARVNPPTLEDDEDEPLAEVPRLPRAEPGNDKGNQNGKPESKTQPSDEDKTEKS